MSTEPLRLFVDGLPTEAMKAEREKRVAISIARGCHPIDAQFCYEEGYDCAILLGRDARDVLANRKNQTQE